MNILLTQRCNRSCPYCFAIKHMDGALPDDIMGWEDLVYLLDMVQAAGDQRVQFLGGEPTLHPQFVDFCLYAISRGLGVTVFTNGMLPPDRLEYVVQHLSRVPDDMLSFVCNINHPDITPPAEQAMIEQFLNAFGRRITPGFNIYRTDFDLGFLFDHISRYGLSRVIRLGLTHPIPGVNNRFIGIDQMRPMLDRLMSFRGRFERQRVKPSPDCGFALCLFTPEELGWLYQSNGATFHFACSPVIDVGPDMTVWACFPLSGHHKRKVFEFDSIQDIYRFYEERHQSIRVEIAGIFAECDECRHREEGVCAGGCAAHALSAFEDESPVRLSEFYQ